MSKVVVSSLLHLYLCLTSLFYCHFFREIPHSSPPFYPTFLSLQFPLSLYNFTIPSFPFLPTFLSLSLSIYIYQAWNVLLRNSASLNSQSRLCFSLSLDARILALFYHKFRCFIFAIFLVRSSFDHLA